MVRGILTDVETGKMKSAIIIRGSSIVIRSVASTDVWNATCHAKLLVFCVHVFHVTHNINGQII
jgi:hypothetical protein